METTKKILIVEDEFLTAKLLAMNLQMGFGYQICGPVSTAEQAIIQNVLDKPDIILMDIRLSGPMTGMEAAYEIRKDYTTPIVFVTGFANADYEQKSRDLGASLLLEKPLHPREIDDAIQSFFSKRG